MACMKFLFGSWVLCKNTDVAVEVSRKYKGNQINQINQITNPVLVTFSMNTHPESVSLDLVGSYRIPRYARDALGHSKVLGSLGNVIVPPIFIASLLPPCNEEINSYFIKKHMGLTFEWVEMVGYRNNRWDGWISEQSFFKFILHLCQNYYCKLRVNLSTFYHQPFATFYRCKP